MLGQQIASLFVKLGADTRDFKKGMDEAAQLTKRQVAKLEAEQKRAESRRNAIITGAAIAGFFLLAREVSKDIALFQGAEKADIRLAQTIRSLGSAAKVTAPELAKMTDELLRTTTFDDEKIKGAETVLLRFGNVRRDMYRDVLKLAADMAAMDGDLEGSMLSLARALEDPAQGIARLKREGVMFSDSQEKMIKALMETGNIAEAQEIIISKLNTQFGGQAQAQVDSYGGRIAILARNFRELRESIGGGILGFTFGADFDKSKTWQRDLINAAEAARDYQIELERIAEASGVKLDGSLSSLARAGIALGKMKDEAKAAADEAYRLANGIKEVVSPSALIKQWEKEGTGTLYMPENLMTPYVDEGKYRAMAYGMATVKKEYVDATEAVKVFHKTEIEAMEQAQYEAGLYTDAVSSITDTLFEMARAGREGWQILADGFSRLVQDMISEMVRLSAYDWFFGLLKPAVGTAAAAGGGGYSTGSDVGYHGNYGPNQSRVAVNIIDQRAPGSPALSAQTSTGANGSQMVEIIVSDALNGLYNNGKLDKLFGRYGANRQVTVG